MAEGSYRGNGWLNLNNSTTYCQILVTEIQCVSTLWDHRDGHVSKTEPEVEMSRQWLQYKTVFEAHLGREWRYLHQIQYMVEKAKPEAAEWSKEAQLPQRYSSAL